MVRAGRYNLFELLGRGAFGEVWVGLADDGSRVAVKVLEVTTGWAALRFQREVAVLAMLDHPGCVRLIDHGFLESERPYLAMELVDGETLGTWLERTPSLSSKLFVARRIAEATRYAHTQGVLHRDLKPGNVLIMHPDAEQPVVKIVDFGISKLSGLELRDITETGEVLGTPGYMSPEQLRGVRDIGPPTDVYALGVILFKMLEGRAPYSGNSAFHVAMKHLTETTPLISPQFDARLRSLVGGMLEKEPADRPTMHDVIVTLGGEQRSSAASPRDIEPHDPPPKTALWIASGGALVIGAVAVAVLTQTLPPAPTPAPAPASRHADQLVSLVAGVELAVVDQGGPDLDVGGADEGVTLITDAGRIGDIGRSHGCGGPGRSGRQKFDHGDREVRVVVPEHYDSSRQYGVLLVLHDVGQVPSGLLKVPALRKYAQRRDLIIVAPSDETVDNVWTEREDAESAVADLEAVGDRYCVDPSRTYIIGHGNGAVGAEEIACRISGVRAMALTAHRHWGDHVPCALGPPVPTLLISPLDDPVAPVDGFGACGRNHPHTLAEEERMLQRHHQCEGPPHRTLAKGGVVCSTARCDVELEWCEIPGGRDWNVLPRRAFTSFPPCGSRPGHFDHAARIATFFDRYQD